MSAGPNQPPFGAAGSAGLPVIRIRQARSSLTVVLLSVALGLSLIVNLVALVVIAELRTTVVETAMETAEEDVGEAEFFLLQPADEEDPSSSEESLSVSGVYQAAIDSVVTIYCRNGSGTGFSFAITPPAGMQSIIVTNHHVVEDCLSGASAVTLQEISGRQSAGSVVGYDRDNDLALIASEVELPVLYPSRGAQIGDQVLAIGSPGGPNGVPLEGTLTQGIISGIRDQIYQTDAAINPGNSGGPLIDLFGGVVGVNTAYWVEDSRIGFAVGVELLCERLIRCGTD